MRFKTVPPTPPADVATSDALGATRDALPLVPRSEDDCCGRLVDRVAWIEDRETATEWIGFLRALDLAERSEAGYARIREKRDENDQERGEPERSEPKRSKPERNESNRSELAERFRDRILGADEAIDALGSEPRQPDAVFEGIVDVVPEWERRRSDAWRDEWVARTERLLDWTVLLDLAERRAGGYVAPGP